MYRELLACGRLGPGVPSRPFGRLRLLLNRLCGTLPVSLWLLGALATLSLLDSLGAGA